MIFLNLTSRCVTTDCIFVIASDVSHHHHLGLVMCEHVMFVKFDFQDMFNIKKKTKKKWLAS